MKRKPYSGSFRRRDYRFEEVSYVGPHFFQGVNALLWYWTQVLHAANIKAGQTGSSTSENLVVAFHRSMSIEVILYDRHTDLTGSLNRLLDLFNLLVSSSLTVQRIRKASDHHVSDS